MKGWIIYGLLSGAVYGLSAVPLKIAAAKGGTESLAVIVLASACGALMGAMVYALSVNRPAVILEQLGCSTAALAVVSGLIGLVAGLLVTKSLAEPGARMADVMALVNTSVLFAMLFGVLLLKESLQGAQLLRSAGGAILVVIGSILICL